MHALGARGDAGDTRRDALDGRGDLPGMFVLAPRAVGDLDRPLDN
jgi:hypothetical protein